PLARQYPTNTRTIATSTPDSTPPSYVTDPARPPGGTTARARERTTPTHGAGDRMFHAPARRAGRRLVAALRARGRSLLANVAWAIHEKASRMTARRATARLRPTP